jgi:hypothetical protein
MSFAFPFGRLLVTFAQDLIYDVTRSKVQTPERVGLAVLLKNLTDSVELVKVRQTLCRVGTDFVCLLTYEFCLSLWNIARCSVILLLSLFINITNLRKNVDST